MFINLLKHSQQNIPPSLTCMHDNSLQQLPLEVLLNQQTLSLNKSSPPNSTVTPVLPWQLYSNTNINKRPSTVVQEFAIS